MNMNERNRIGMGSAQKWGGEGGGVGLVHDKPGEGTIEYRTRSCPFHKGLGKGVGNEDIIYRIRGLLKMSNRR
jgi:hypothetical protein